MTAPDDRPQDDSVETPAGEHSAAPRPGGPAGQGRPAGSFGDVAGETGEDTEVEAGDASTGPEADGEPFDPAAQAASDELAVARAEAAERLLDLQRLQAEFLNYKRRVERDRELVQQNATFTVLTGLLPVLDDIDRAREHGEVEGGFKAVADALDRTVAQLGLTKYAATGDAFDPTLHEALMHGLSPEVTTTTVDVVAQAGYRIGERVVRAAKVTVLDPEG
ncbi:molecular chaperone GrpE [Nocardioides scoriae]|uniref:Protein GrpE n=1 Tax=Nocardioides scoriae TaxID=642780 RepID=A0A1H1WK12_9ACTN|nr:nucleotide exchange factor GrpE [Nocardioides scoriae]SDS97332.1 molecular chaperone GrpE [Nocardioides scoriae]